jgi:hypothetical protein
MNTAPSAVSVSTSTQQTALTPLTPSAIGPSLVDLEDLLYDILASGADPNLSTETIEAVQLFVHEHARSKKTQAEFLAFFAEQSLSTQPERSALMALPPLEGRGRAAETPQLTSLPQQNDPPLSVAEAVFVPDASTGLRVWTVVAIFAAVSCVAGAAAYAFFDVREELAAMQSEAALNSAALTSARAETETLRADLRAQAERLEHAEHNSDLLLQSFASPLDPNSK